MDGVKAFLTKQIGPFPVYAYIGGLVVLVGAYIYFKKHSTGSGTTAITAAPQTNYPTDGINPTPLPYPLGNTPPVPPTAPFATPGPSGIASYLPAGSWYSNSGPAVVGPSSGSGVQSGIGGVRGR
jgi:hypothetical protein